jgi:hypothetical protein
MGVTPASDAFAAYPSDVVEEAKRRVRHMVDGGMVQKYAKGNEVISDADLYQVCFRSIRVYLLRRLWKQRQSKRQAEQTGWPYCSSY